jgi:hypothetical protein
MAEMTTAKAPVRAIAIGVAIAALMGASAGGGYLVGRESVDDETADAIREQSRELRQQEFRRTSCEQAPWLDYC